MELHITLGLDNADRWYASLRYDQWITRTVRHCCEQAHETPEEAAGHGSAIAAIELAAHARSLEPPAAGALALQSAGPRDTEENQR